jgi:hypothetical protein
VKFITNRDKVLSSVLGHTIEFKKDVPTFVPKELWAEVQAIGAIPEEDLPETVKAETAEPDDPTSRKKLIFDGFKALVEGAQRESFSAVGTPHVKAIAAQIGFVLEAKERDALWQEFKAQDSGE